jgi:hypothetical protein
LHACHCTQGSRVQTWLRMMEGVIRAIKICSTTSFGGEIKMLVPCHRFIAYKRNLWAWKGCFVGKTQWPCFFTHVSPALLLDDSTGKGCQKLADKSGLIRNCVRWWACLPLLKKHLKVNNSSKFGDGTVPTGAVKLIKW